MSEVRKPYRVTVKTEVTFTLMARSEAAAEVRALELASMGCRPVSVISARVPWFGGVVELPHESVEYDRDEP
ncbi:MAG: hypothetical protein WC869_00635 [Phycisphaerae bacterium]|jgi:hypothetical protein